LRDGQISRQEIEHLAVPRKTIINNPRKADSRVGRNPHGFSMRIPPIAAHGAEGRGLVAGLGGGIRLVGLLGLCHGVGGRVPPYGSCPARCASSTASAILWRISARLPM
jgi:hypothetical protein